MRERQHGPRHLRLLCSKWRTCTGRRGRWLFGLRDTYRLQFLQSLNTSLSKPKTGVHEDARFWFTCLLVYLLLSPIHHRIVIGVIAFRVAPVVIEFVRQRIFIEFDPQAGFGWQIDETLFDDKWPL